MMDIVERLRNPSGTVRSELMDEAAAEIEQLRADLDLRNQTALDRKKAIVELEAENERLRAALESLAKDPPATLDEPDEDWEVIVKMRAIARKAISADVQTRDKNDG